MSNFGNVFPKLLSSQSLDTTNNTPQTVDITFSYRYWTNPISEQDLLKPLLIHYKELARPS